MTLVKAKCGVTRLWIVLAVAYDLFVLFAIVQDYGHEAAKDLLQLIGIVSLMNVAWFIILKVCFWIVDGFANQKGGDRA